MRADRVDHVVVADDKNDCDFGDFVEVVVSHNSAAVGPLSDLQVGFQPVFANFLQDAKPLSNYYFYSDMNCHSREHIT